ncbi:DUF1015 domain-containing protein [Dethiobacter alkaliphilus]|uniref:DUF1015 domain-containing protein n=1 Tax=Dethiobacter alkaliphilus AHT 1 TaxID=555088 RepID=C0GHD7_DETAL|nr:DUF1015 domain-containing protein [Dethiobacter alkaliphilus]EEG77143.1 conserved hypothetical protein [Dethiobacter alkaliphilus AHT 1]
MAKIVPIRGVRYNPEKAGEMADLVTPPYDVIDEAEQRRFYEKNDYNVIRLEYGEVQSTDHQQENRYTRAREFFTSWLEEEILIHDENSSIYLYEQEFTAGDTRLTRSGFIAGVGVEDYETGKILPHEETLSKAKADRLELLRHCHANFSPIFGLYDDPALTVENIAARYKQELPDLMFTDEGGETHRLWIVSDKEDLQTIQSFFTPQKVYIADGHHRYETALNFHKEMQAQGKNDFGFCLMTLVNLHDPGLVIYPTHRMIKNVQNFNKDTFTEELSKVFTIKELELPAANRAENLSTALQNMENKIDNQHAFLAYVGDGKLYELTFPRDVDNHVMAHRCGSKSPAWRNLDVAVLQCLILEDILGIDQEARTGGVNLAYTREEVGALDKVDSGDFQAVIFMNPTLVREVTEVAAAGDKMPQKSTYFYPKLITGLVINDFTVK